MGAEQYFSKDFEWEELEREVLNDPSFLYHLLPFEPPSSSSSSAICPPDEESIAWRKFHSRHHTGKFFKERRYLLKEFPELVSCGKDSRVLEGCPVTPLMDDGLYGSHAMYVRSQYEKGVLFQPEEWKSRPFVTFGHVELLSDIFFLSRDWSDFFIFMGVCFRSGNENVTLYACDCSSEALEYAREMVDTANLASGRDRFHPFFCDFSLTGFPQWLVCGPCRKTSLSRSFPSDLEEVFGTITGEIHSSKESSCCLGGLDLVTLIFTLSAIPFQMMPSALTECFYILKPGGFILFRDYGLFDMTMLRFQPDKRVGFREYMRADGTRSYFFSLDTVRDLFLRSGFVEVELDYCCINSLNRKKGKSMHRVWVHGKFQKPPL